MKKISNKVINNLFSTNKEVVEESFNVIYNEFSYLIYYLSLKIVKDESMASEITNETFMMFFINKDRIDIYKNLKYYLTSTAKNLSINYLNKINKLEPLNDNISVFNTNVDHFNEYIEKFKDFLDEQEIDLIVLHLLYDFTFKEIAKEKNVSINVITSKYNRAIKKVRKHYKEG